VRFTDDVNTRDRLNSFYPAFDMEANAWHVQTRIGCQRPPIAIDSPGQTQNNTGCYRSLTHHPRSVSVRELEEIYASETVFYPVLAAGGRRSSCSTRPNPLAGRGCCFGLGVWFRSSVSRGALRLLERPIRLEDSLGATFGFPS